MGVPCADDVMLNYQSTSFHDVATVRRLFGLRPAPEFLAWLQERGVFVGNELAPGDAGCRRLLSQAEHLLSFSPLPGGERGERGDDDARTLQQWGYTQELARRMSPFSNFALSLSIICILAGGVT